MTAYIIAYSIILCLLSIAVVSVCVVVMLFQKKKLREETANIRKGTGDDAVISDFTEKHLGAAAIILEDRTLRPVYAGGSVDHFLGVSKQELMRDGLAGKNSIERKYMRKIEQSFAIWDRNEPLVNEFGFGEDGVARLEAYKMKSGEKDYLAFVMFDITEQKKEYADMQKRLDAALDQAAAKSSFLSSMSHEIRTPMNGIMGMMSLARMNINDSKKVMNYLERAGDLSVFLLGMINDILDISKIESGKMVLFNTQLDIFAFADKIRNMFEGTVTGKGINFKVETVDFTARHLIGDELRLTQVVTNLVSNANKFTPPGGEIDVTFKQLDCIGGKIQFMIRVRDTGKGIAPENIHKIMRPFEQEEVSTAHRYGGTGLGLAICDNIVNLMGGNITIDSTLGKGTDFSVFLAFPLADVVQDLDTPIEGVKGSEKTDFTFKGCRILLAEDNEVNAEIAVEILSSEGAKVTLAHDGREAVEIFEKKKAGSFDVLLLDIQMPRLDGRSAAGEIRKSGKADALSVPIIALSADAFVEDIKLSEEAGMDGHVSKPIDFGSLASHVGKIIAAKKSEKK